jgi:hypothetical protein
MAITNDLPASFAGLVRWLVVLSDWSDREWLNLRGPKHLECDIVIRSYSADSIRDRSDKLHTKSGCMAAIFTFSKLLIESLAKVGVHVWAQGNCSIAALTFCFQEDN